MKKLPATLAEDDLLKILEDKTVDAPEQLSEHSVIQFLADFGIYPGKSKVSGTMLYKLYKNANPYKFVSSWEFHALLKGYLEHIIEGKALRVIYLLNRDTKNITLELTRFLSKKELKGESIKSKEYARHFERFLKRYILKPGQGRIPVTALYFFYDKWKYNEDKKDRLTLRYITFVKMIKMHFKTLKTKYYNCVVKIDREFFKQFTEEEIKIALNWAQIYSEKKHPNKKKIPKGEKQTF